MFRFISVFFPPVIAAALWHKTKKGNRPGFTEWGLSYGLFTLGTNFLMFAWIYLFKDPEAIKDLSYDFTASFAAQYMLLGSVVAVILFTAAIVLKDIPFLKIIKDALARFIKMKRLMLALGIVLVFCAGLAATLKIVGIKRDDALIAGQIWSAENSVGQQEWTEAFAPLMAHAGGRIGEDSGTNSLEALNENYALGHRVFEMDFNFTSDGRLAAVHQWEDLDPNGEYNPFSADEWKEYKFKGAYTTMLLEDVLDWMMVHDDTYLVTDTKSFGIDQSVVRRQFQEIFDQASIRDPALLDRIIPQIYNERMYHTVVGIYAYPSIIYTLYMASSSNDDILKFVADKQDIQVITMPGNRVSREFCLSLIRLDKYCYVHTFNDTDKMRELAELGVRGFYTDDVIPADYEKIG